MSRASREAGQTIEVVQVGDVDSMSSMAKKFGARLCHQTKPHTRSHCTRIAGHDESKVDHPGTLHVATDQRDIARAVW